MSSPEKQATIWMNHVIYRNWDDISYLRPPTPPESSQSTEPAEGDGREDDTNPHLKTLMPPWRPPGSPALNIFDPRPGRSPSPFCLDDHGNKVRAPPPSAQSPHQMHLEVPMSVKALLDAVCTKLAILQVVGRPEAFSPQMTSLSGELATPAFSPEVSVNVPNPFDITFPATPLEDLRTPSSPTTVNQGADTSYFGAKTVHGDTSKDDIPLVPIRGCVAVHGNAVYVRCMKYDHWKRVHGADLHKALSLLTAQGSPLSESLVSLSSGE